MEMRIHPHDSHDDRDTRPRIDTGWREGRPLEDPEKTKNWGTVSAHPSEYLIHMRRGRVLERSSGQGASCFKRPRDAIALVPTSLQRLRFQADQVTLEKVGVEVTGLLVYRIANPRMAFRVLNFSFPERAQEKLEHTLTEMFVGATRRLVANLTVEQCMTQRKGALADELIRELAPVLAGNGNPDDESSTGWGVVIDTIEIQDVNVLSDRVFAAMQAPFRMELKRKAEQAQQDAEKEILLRKAECDSAVEEDRINKELAIGTQQNQLNEAQAEDAKAKALREVEVTRTTEEAKLAAQSAVAELQRQKEQEKIEFLSRQKVREEDLRRSENEAKLSAEEEIQRQENELKVAQQERELQLRVAYEEQRSTENEAKLKAEEEIQRQENELKTAQQERAAQLLLAEKELAQQVALKEIEASDTQHSAEEKKNALQRLGWQHQLWHRQMLSEQEAQSRQAIAEVRIREAQGEEVAAAAKARIIIAEKMPELAKSLGQQIKEVRISQFGGEGNPFAMLTQGVSAVMDLLKKA